MRNWTFMALREITDQPLAADASVWQDWYAQHGTEKMADSNVRTGGESTAISSGPR